MARWRTHHRRKMQAQEREIQRWKRFDALLAKLTEPAFIEAAMLAWVRQMQAAFAQAVAALSQGAFPLLHAPEPVQLDAEPFWDEWPEVIGE